MEAAQPGIAEGGGNAGARVQVFREAGVEGGGELPAAADGERAHGDTQWPLGGDVQRFRREGVHHAGQGAPRQQREADIGVGRAGQGAKPVRPDDFGGVAHRIEFAREGGEGAHDPVHLGEPGVRDDEDALRRQ